MSDLAELAVSFEGLVHVPGPPAPWDSAEVFQDLLDLVRRREGHAFQQGLGQQAGIVAAARQDEADRPFRCQLAACLVHENQSGDQRPDVALHCRHVPQDLRHDDRGGYFFAPSLSALAAIARS